MSKKKKKHQTHKKQNTSTQPKNRKQKQIKSAPVKKEQHSTVELFNKYIGKKAGWIVLGLIIIIGLTAFKDYLFVKYMYFFKDIGSDSLNIAYPSIMHYVNLMQDSFFGVKYSFYQGMGTNVFSGFPVDPYTLFIKLLGIIGISIGGDDFLLLSKFPRIFLYYILPCGLVAYGYLRTFNISYYSSTIGALMFAFCGYSIMGSSWDYSQWILYFIFLLFAFEQLFKKKRWYFFPFAVLLMGRNPFYLYLSGVFLLLYTTFRYFDENNKNFKGYGILLAQMVGFGLLGMLINSINLINPYLKIFNSPRVAGAASTISSGGSASVFNINNYSELLTVLYRTFSTDLMGNGSNYKGWYNYLEAPAFYSGVIALLLIPQAFIALTKRQKILYGAFLGFWVLVVVIPQLRHALQLFVGNYYKGLLDIIITAVMVFFSVKAIDIILTQNKVNGIVLISSIILILIALYYPGLEKNPQFPGKDNPLDKGIRNMVALFIIFYGGMLFFMKNKKYRFYIQIALLLTVVIELSYMSHITVNRREAYRTALFMKNKGGYNDATMEALAYIEKNDSTPFFRIEKDYSSGTAIHGSLNDAQAQGYYGTANYSSFNDIDYIRFLEETEIIKKGVETSTRWAPGLRGRPLLYSFGSIKYHLSKQEKPAFLGAGFKQIGTFNDVKLLENQFYIPFGFTYKHYIDFEKFQKLSIFQKQVVLLQAFVYEKNSGVDISQCTPLPDSLVNIDEKNFTFEIYQQFSQNRQKDTLIITQFKNDNIKGTIDLDNSKHLFFSIVYDPGWKIIVNGKEQTLKLSNIGFSGITLPKGKHEIELKYVPPYLYEGIALSSFGYFIFFVILGFDIRKKRKIKKTKN